MSKFKFKESLIDDYLYSLEKNPFLIKNKKISDKVELLISQMDLELNEKKHNLSILIEANDSLIDTELNYIPNYHDIIKDIKYNILLLEHENFTLDKLIESNNHKYKKNKLENDVIEITNQIEIKKKEKNDLVILYNQTEILIEPESIEIISNNNNTDYIQHLKNKKKNKTIRIENLKEIDKQISDIDNEINILNSEYDIQKNNIEKEKIEQINYFNHFDGKLSNNCKHIKLKIIASELETIENNFNIKVKKLEDNKKIIINSRKKYNDVILFLNKKNIIKRVDNINIEDKLKTIQESIVLLDNIIDNLNDKLLQKCDENNKLNDIVKFDLARNNGYLYTNINTNNKVKNNLQKKLNNIMMYKLDLEISIDNKQIKSFQTNILEYENELDIYKSRYTNLKLI